jgi:hypothetical protein
MAGIDRFDFGSALNYGCFPLPSSPEVTASATLAIGFESEQRRQGATNVDCEAVSKFIALPACGVSAR